MLRLGQILVVVVSLMTTGATAQLTHAQDQESQFSEPMLWISDAASLLESLGDFAEPVQDGFEELSWFALGQTDEAAARRAIEDLRLTVQSIQDTIHFIFDGMSERPEKGGATSGPILPDVPPIDTVVERMMLKSDTILSLMDAYVQAPTHDTLQPIALNIFSLYREAIAYERIAYDLRLRMTGFTKPAPTIIAGYINQDAYIALDTLLVTEQFGFDDGDVTRTRAEFDSLVNKQPASLDEVRSYEAFIEEELSLIDSDLQAGYLREYQAQQRRKNGQIGLEACALSIATTEQLNAIFKEVQTLLAEPVSETRMSRLVEKTKEVKTILDADFEKQVALSRK